MILGVWPMLAACWLFEFGALGYDCSVDGVFALCSGDCGIVTFVCWLGYLIAA